MKTELETLKEMRSEIDAKIEKLSKPEFEYNKWYKKNKALIYFTSEGCTNYGFDIDYGKWHDNLMLSFDGLKHDWTLATPTEVQQALEMEYKKRGYERGKWIDLDRKDVTNICSLNDIEFFFKNESNELWVQGCGTVFQNGVWAEIVKPMSLDELANNYNDYYCNNSGGVIVTLKQYLTENKTQIIETLNNL